MLDTSIQIKTDRFDGPLALLLLLIQKEQMDIKSLDLSTITGQYLAYLDKMHELNFDVAGDYLYLAATLIYLKSKECLTEEDHRLMGEFSQSGESLKIDSQSDLITRLEQLHRFQKLGQALWSLPKLGHQIFIRPKIQKKYLAGSFLRPTDMADFTNSMVDFLIRERRKFKMVKRDRLSIKEKLEYLRKLLKVGDKRTLRTLVEEQNDNTLTNLVINFISLLELARLKKLNVYQTQDKGDVYLEVIKSLDDLDLESADGFEPESDQKQQNSEQTIAGN